MADEKLLILPINDRNSKKISQVLSNDTSRKVLEALADKPMSTTEISEKLGAPLTTLHYNIENLLATGLIKVERTRYSEKGREVKYYGPTRKFIILAPENVGERETKQFLKRTLFGVYFIIGAVFSGYLFQRLYYLVTGGFGFPGGGTGTSSIMAGEAKTAAAPTMAPPEALLDAGEYGGGSGVTTGGNLMKEAAASKAAGQVQNVQNVTGANVTPITPGGGRETADAAIQSILPQTQAPISLPIQPPVEQNLYLWFLFGAVFALLLLFVWNKIRRRIE